MNTIRNRLEQLLNDSGAYQQGRQDERERLQNLIYIRIDQLQIIDRHHRQQICTELLQLRQLLEP